MFLSDLCLCAKACFIRGRGEPCVCVERTRPGQCDATCVCLCACLRVFVGKIPGQYHA